MSAGTWPDHVVALLHAAGWEHGRAVPVEDWRSMLAERGFVMHGAAEKFLAEFGGSLWMSAFPEWSRRTTVL
ncbi:hypothetical protein DMC63_11760 [Streptomyces sp. WAC 05977]|nr:hypothetical protein DMC63_11760 [Streptomyces sp. WAC 05977]